MDPKPDYKPPTSAQEILHRYAQGEREFRDVKIDKLDLSNQQLPKIVLSGCRLPHAKFAGSNLEAAQFSSTFLVFADFTGANLTDAQMAGALLHDSKFGAKLNGANLQGAQLVFAKFDGAELPEAVLTKANLRYAHGLEFDQNEIRGIAAPTRVSSLAKYVHAKGKPQTFWERASFLWHYYTLRGYPKWLVLQQEYTGPWLVVYLLLTVLALLPYLATLIIWQGVAAFERLPAVAEAIRRSFPSANAETWQAWQLLLGLHRGRWGATFLTIVMLLFVFLRALVTVKVSALKHAQDLSGWTPARGEYWWLVPVHFVVSTLWIVAISSITWHIWDWLTTPLIVFR